jgi:hypothetical protein
MKQFLKNLGTGLLFFLLSFCSSCFGLAAYYGFVAISETSGWTAIGLCLVSIVMALIMGFLVYCMGLIPNDTIESLKGKITELEEKEYDQV